MLDELHSFGLSHASAPLPARERLAALRPDEHAIRTWLDDLASEVVVLSTCGRFEIYVVGSPTTDWPAALARLWDVPREWVTAHLSACRGVDVVRHALRVAAGLDSAIFAEDEILAQVRAAFDAAQRADRVGAVLSTLFRTAIHTGRQVRHATAPQGIAHSYAAHAVERLDDTTLRRGSVLILGTGQLARQVAQRLTARGADVVLCSRHASRAATVATELHVGWLARHDLAERIPGVSAIVGCAVARHPLITPDLVRAAHLTIIDLGMPRNVDPAVADPPRITLHDLDTLPIARAAHQVALERAERLVEGGLQRFGNWVAGRAAAAAIAQARAAARRSTVSPTPQHRRQLHARILALKDGGRS